MNNSDLLYAIGRYCKQQHFHRTLKALDQRTDKTPNSKKDQKRTVVTMFENYLKSNNEEEGLSFTFKLTNNLSHLRKRLLDTEYEKRPVAIKKLKVIKARKSDIPDTFLTLLDELGLDRKNGKLLYENKDQWTYVKSDKLIYCTERGNFSLTNNRIRTYILHRVFVFDDYITGLSTNSLPKTTWMETNRMFV